MSEASECEREGERSGNKKCVVLNKRTYLELFETKKQQECNQKKKTFQTVVDLTIAKLKEWEMHENTLLFNLLFFFHSSCGMKNKPEFIPNKCQSVESDFCFYVHPNTDTHTHCRSPCVTR